MVVNFGFNESEALILLKEEKIHCRAFRGPCPHGVFLGRKVLSSAGTKRLCTERKSAVCQERGQHCSVAFTV